MEAQSGSVATLTATLQERESEVKRLEEKNTVLCKGVELHKTNMLCLQPLVSELSRNVGALELDRHRLTVALTEVEKTKKELSTAVGELELDRHRLTMALTEREGEVERLKKEKKELQETVEARQSDLSPEVALLSENVSKCDSSLQELICKINVS